MNQNSRAKEIQGEAGTSSEEGARHTGSGAKGTGGGARPSCVTSTPVKKITLEELRKQLRKLNLPTTGNKADLQQRLKNYERMKKAISTVTPKMTRLSSMPRHEILKEIRTTKRNQMTRMKNRSEYVKGQIDRIQATYEDDQPKVTKRHPKGSQM